jgi:cytochrome c oxidase subunit IV
MNINADPTRTYILTGAALLGLLTLTIAFSYLDLGALNPVVTAAISIASTTLIILFYMNLHRSKPLLWVFVGAGFFWLGIMFTLALSDFLTRGWR